MDQVPPSANGARRNEDIALDLLKFVAGSTGVVRGSTPSTGFAPPEASKPEDQVTHLLQLYARCLRVVEGKPA